MTLPRLPPRQRFDKLVTKLRLFRLRPGFHPVDLNDLNIATAYLRIALCAEIAGDDDTARAAATMAKAWCRALNPEKNPCKH